MRRRVVAPWTCAVLLMCAAAAAAAQAPGPPINVVAPGDVAISNDWYRFAARPLAPKPDMALGKVFKGITPLMNLDLRFLERGDYKTFPVKVWIPLAYIERTARRNPRSAAATFAVWVGDHWVSGAAGLKEAGVVNVRIEGTYLTFEVTAWPDDDRMIGC